MYLILSWGLGWFCNYTCFPRLVFVCPCATIFRIGRVFRVFRVFRVSLSPFWPTGLELTTVDLLPFDLRPFDLGTEGTEGFPGSGYSIDSIASYPVSQWLIHRFVPDSLASFTTLFVPVQGAHQSNQPISHARRF